MVIRFKKGKNQWKHKPDTLTCIRDDGSVTWTYLHREFAIQDLAHYVVETTLGLENAFLGLIAKGYDISDFNQPKAERPFEIPKEALNTEVIVGLLQTDLLESLRGNADRCELLRDYGALLPVKIADVQLETMQQKLQALLQKWHDLQPGESMVLQFKI
ncbi:MAG: hypothetical protein OYL97_24350 [Candidatus Poribacteria bacterium]|nr:hypothetical protein [Candidatus Poribacteria bacterium]